MEKKYLNGNTLIADYMDSKVHLFHLSWDFLFLALEKISTIGRTQYHISSETCDIVPVIYDKNKDCKCSDLPMIKFKLD